VYIFYSVALQTKETLSVGSSVFCRHLLILFRRRSVSSQGICLHTTTQKQNTQTFSYIHAAIMIRTHNSNVQTTEDSMRARSVFCDTFPTFFVAERLRYIVVREESNVTVDVVCWLIRVQAEFVFPKYDIWSYVLRRIFEAMREITSRRIKMCIVFMFEIPAGEANRGTTRA